MPWNHTIHPPGSLLTGSFEACRLTLGFTTVRLTLCEGIPKRFIGYHKLIYISMQYERLLSKAGQAGPFQLMLFLLVGIVNMYTGMENMVINFLSPTTHAHWCLVPELRGLSELEAWELAIPWDETTGDYESCRRYDVISPNHSLGPDDVIIDNQTVTSCDSGWIFDQSVFQTTIISEWSLVCENEGVLNLISPIYTAGLLVGSVIGGMVSDSLGRLMALLVFTLVHLVAGVATSLSVNVWMFMVFRFLVAVSIRGAGISGAVLLMETLSSRFRVAAVVGYQMFLGLGIVCTAAIAQLVPNFRDLQFILVVPLAAMVVYKWLIPESPRWSMSKGYIDDVIHTLCKIGRMNGKPLDDDDCQAFKKSNEKLVESEQGDGIKCAKDTQLTFLDLFRHPVLRRYTLSSYFLMSVCIFIDLGVAMNISTLFGDVYTNTYLAGGSEMAANFLIYFGLQFLGRRPPLAFCFVAVVASEGCSIWMQVIDYRLASSILSILSRCLSSSGYLTLSIYVAELFPTPVRQAALGSANAVAAAVGILAPLVGGNLHEVWFPLPNIIFGSLALLAIPVCFLIPETLGRQMPETLDDAVSDKSSETACNKSMDISVVECPEIQHQDELLHSIICDVIGHDSGFIAPLSTSVASHSSHRHGNKTASPDEPIVDRKDWPSRHTHPLECGVFDGDNNLLYQTSSSVPINEGFTNIVCIAEESSRPTGLYIVPNINFTRL